MWTFSPLLLAIAQAITFSALGTSNTHTKRGAETKATLLAYGTNSDGWPIAYNTSDSLLYIAIDPSNSTVSLVPLLWNLAAITQEDWIANATFVNGTSAGVLYIRPEDNALSIAAIPEVDETPKDAYNGFALFATQLVYDNETNLQAQFWGVPTDLEDVYALVWLEDETETAEGGFPVVVKGVEG